MEQDEFQRRLLELLLNFDHVGCLVVVITKTGCINIKGVANKEVFDRMGKEVLHAENVLFEYLCSGEIEPGSIHYPKGVN